MTSLLSILDLESRIVYQEDDEKIQYTKYDVSKVQELLQAEREKSIDYLKASLN